MWSCQLVTLVLLTTLTSSRITAMAPATSQTPFYTLGLPRHAGATLLPQGFGQHQYTLALGTSVPIAPSTGSAFPEDTKCLLSSLSQAFS